jgi:hypothetical protein
VTGVLLLTGVELETLVLARELELRRLPGVPFPVFDRPSRRPPGSGAPPVRLRVAPAGLRASSLPDRWARLVADLSAPLVVSAGTCGALAPGLRVGDLIVPESVLAPGGERLNVTPGVHRAALGLAGQARTGILLTSSEIVGTPAAKAACHARTGALAVDLESAPILAWASSHGCPTLVVRAVSDTWRQHVPPELVGLLTPEGKLQAGRALALTVRRPGTIPRALALRRGARRALKAVARLIAALTMSSEGGFAPRPVEG